MKAIKILACAIALLAMSCSDDDSSGYNPNPEPAGNFSENFGPAVTRDFVGRVVDVDENPIVNATIRIGTSTAQTDSNGIFILNGANVNEDFAYITATKPGYVDGSRALVPTAGKNQVNIMLLPLDVTATIQSGQNSTVTHGDSQVAFDGAFMDANGQSYSGAVNVSMYHLKPSNAHLHDIMPGMLYAQNAQGQERVLETYGMLHVELRGEGGQKLQIASGHTAGIRVAIDPTQAAIAPATIPLWHFDQEKGYWIESGSAAKQGNQYFGTVSHFSWWNCDMPYELVELGMTLVDEGGTPLPGVWVNLTYNEMTTTGVTDSQGHVSGLVPMGATLEMNVYFHSVCGSEVVHHEVIGPFTSDTTLPNIIIATPQIDTVVIQGHLTKCDNSDVTNGYVMFRTSANALTFATVTNGSFSFNTIVCNSGPDTFVLKGVDYDSLQQTDSLYYTFNTPVTNVGTITACDAVEEFMSYQIDSNPTVILTAITNGSIYNGTWLNVGAYNQNQNGFTVYGNAIVPGVYTTANFSIEGSIGYIHSGSVNTMVFTVSNVGNVGEFIDLTFNGTFTDDSGLHTLNGTAHIKRDN